MKTLAKSLFALVFVATLSTCIFAEEQQDVDKGIDYEETQEVEEAAE